MDVASVPHSVQVDTGKIGVKKMTIERKKTAAPTIPEEKARQQTQEVKTEQPSEEKIKQEAATKLATERAAAKETVEKALALLGGKRENARMVLRLLSGGEATLGALSGQMEAEFEIANKINSNEEKQRKITEIQNRYQKLFQYAENRQTETKKNIEKLKRSQKPEDQALALDIEMARDQIDMRSYDMSISNLGLILKNNISPTTGGALSASERTKFEAIKDSYETKSKTLNIKNEELKAQREKIKAVDGGEIANVIEATAVVIAGENVEGVKQAQENPIGYLEEVMANALTNKEAMIQLTDSLVKANILNEADKENFIKDMKLGLTTEETLDMVKSTGGKTITSLISVLGMLGYVAWKKMQEGGGQQMMG
jgi:hypothetical protein